MVLALLASTLVLTTPTGAAAQVETDIVVDSVDGPPEITVGRVARAVAALKDRTPPPPTTTTTTTAVAQSLESRP